MRASPIRRLADAAGRAADRLEPWVVPAAAAAAALLALLLFQSIFWAAHVPWPLKLAVAAIAAITVRRPPDGLLIVAGLAPLGYMLTTRVAGAYPARITEAIALAFLAGWAARAAADRLGRRRAAAPPAGEAPWLLAAVLLLGAAALASAVVQYHAMQVWHDRPGPFFARLVDFLVHGYHDALGNYEPRAPDAGFRFVFITAFTLEGAALCLAAARFAARDPEFGPRLRRMIVAGAAGAAALSFHALGRAALETADPIGALPALLARRWTMFTPKLNTAASLFVLAGPIALGAAAAARRRGHRAGWIAAAALLTAALWINGTRVALIAAILVLAAAGAWLARGRLRRPAPAVVAGAAILGAGLAGTAFHRLWVDQDAALAAVRWRVQFNETALRMFASAPVFGVGIDQYYLQSETFAPEALLVDYRRVPAHNPFLQTAAELGVVGLAPFVWLIGMAGWTAVRAVRNRPRDPVRIGLLAGLAAFLFTTASSGHPLLIEVTAYPFWIVLGLAAARAGAEDGVEDGAPAPARRAPAPRSAAPWTRRALVAGAVLIAVSVPARIAQGRRGIDFPAIGYGLHGLEDNGVDRYRWSTGHATLFVDADADAGAGAVELPLRAPRVDATGPMQVDLFLDGQAVARVEIHDPAWTPVRVALPPGRSGYRRLDLLVGPTWVPADLLPGSTDTRELGVMVGDLRPAAPPGP